MPYLRPPLAAFRVDAARKLASFCAKPFSSTGIDIPAAVLIWAYHPETESEPSGDGRI